MLSSVAVSSSPAPDPIVRGRCTSDLVTQARDGDENAILSLLAISQPDIRRYARRTCSVEDVDDAVQEALWLVYRRIGSLKVVASFSSWLFAIIKRECMRLRRQSVKIPLTENMELDLFVADRQDLELRHDLAVAIHSLPPHYRDVVLLRDVEELTVDEIASSLAISREAAKARLNRARKLIREYILPQSDSGASGKQISLVIT